MHGKSMCAEKLRGNDGDNEWAGHNAYENYHLMNPFDGDFYDDAHDADDLDVADFCCNMHMIRTTMILMMRTTMIDDSNYE